MASPKPLLYGTLAIKESSFPLDWLLATGITAWLLNTFIELREDSGPIPQKLGWYELLSSYPKSIDNVDKSVKHAPFNSIYAADEIFSHIRVIDERPKMPETWCEDFKLTPGHALTDLTMSVEDFLKQLQRGDLRIRSIENFEVTFYNATRNLALAEVSENMKKWKADKSRNPAIANMQGNYHVDFVINFAVPYQSIRYPLLNQLRKLTTKTTLESAQQLVAALPESNPKLTQLIALLSPAQLNGSFKLCYKKYLGGQRINDQHEIIDDSVAPQVFTVKCEEKYGFLVRSDIDIFSVSINKMWPRVAERFSILRENSPDQNTQNIAEVKKILTEFIFKVEDPAFDPKIPLSPETVKLRCSLFKGYFTTLLQKMELEEDLFPDSTSRAKALADYIYERFTQGTYPGEGKAMNIFFADFTAYLFSQFIAKRLEKEEAELYQFFKQSADIFDIPLRLFRHHTDSEYDHENRKVQAEPGVILSCAPNIHASENVSSEHGKLPELAELCDLPDADKCVFLDCITDMNSCREQEQLNLSRVQLAGSLKQRADVSSRLAGVNNPNVKARSDFAKRRKSVDLLRNSVLDPAVDRYQGLKVETKFESSTADNYTLSPLSPPSSIPSAEPQSHALSSSSLTIPRRQNSLTVPQNSSSGDSLTPKLDQKMQIEEARVMNTYTQTQQADARKMFSHCNQQKSRYQYQPRVQVTQPPEVKVGPILPDMELHELPTIQTQAQSMRDITTALRMAPAASANEQSQAHKMLAGEAQVPGVQSNPANDEPPHMQMSVHDSQQQLARVEIAAQPNKCCGCWEAFRRRGSRK